MKEHKDIDTIWDLLARYFDGQDKEHVTACHEREGGEECRDETIDK